MCVIAVAQKRKLTDEELSRMWAANPSGGGVGWLASGQACYKKGFSKLKDLKAFYKGITTFPHVVHFRIPSSGGDAIELTHPFVCSARSPLALEYKGTEELLFHNGTWPSWAEHATAIAAATKPIRGAVNDSRVMAMIRSLVPEYLEQVVGTPHSGGRLAILSPKGKVTLLGGFTEIDGIHVSNKYWKADRSEWAKSTLDWASFGVGPTRDEPTAEDWEGSKPARRGAMRVEPRYRSPWIGRAGVVHGE